MVRVLLSVFLFLAVVMPAWAQQLSARQLEALRQGEALLIEEADQTYSAYVLMSASVDQVYSVLSAFENYQQFMPNVDKVIVRERTQDRVILEYYLALPAGIEKRYRLAMSFSENDQVSEMHWISLPWPGLDPGDTIKLTRGYWKLQPFEGQVLAKYHVYTDPGEVPFGLGWVVDYMSSKSIREVVLNTRDFIVK